ncbi:thiol:disulfide interchange protein (cytochrome C-type biogenesis protein) [Citrobacter koseri]|uniref:Thiol:disulfide interchange protein (Cytochrome C-type biogenesis protein) n=1 Tax=Citrobacter koseri TaxID=545 RepID=A0A447UI80_CITKO|nr:thiol:disulfide interchange protein (cytochrome C-type biogenesis protein) [Citrobacter koseri]
MRKNVFYNSTSSMMTEAAIDGGITRDLYAALGEELDNGAWAVRLYYKPFIRWIWAGGLLMALGGLFCLFDPRYRQRSCPQKNRAGGCMKRNVLLIPFIIFLVIAAALLWQLARNAEGDDPTNLESALIGKPVPTFRLESLENPGQHYQADVLTQGKPVLLNVWGDLVPDLPR